MITHLHIDVAARNEENLVQVCSNQFSGAGGGRCVC